MRAQHGRSEAGLYHRLMGGPGPPESVRKAMPQTLCARATAQSCDRPHASPGLVQGTFVSAADGLRDCQQHSCWLADGGLRKLRLSARQTDAIGSGTMGFGGFSGPSTLVCARESVRAGHVAPESANQASLRAPRLVYLRPHMGGHRSTGWTWRLSLPGLAVSDRALT